MLAAALPTGPDAVQNARNERGKPMTLDGAPNPYTPPTAPLDLPPSDGSPAILKSRRLTRFAGAFLEGLVTGIPGAIALFAMGALGDPAAIRPFQPAYVVNLLISLGFFALNVWLWSTRAQSIGKALVGMRIAALDGRPATLNRLLIRQVPLFLLGLLAGLSSNPLAAGLLGTVMLVDVLAILLPDRRCLHDYWAGTIVVEASPVNDPTLVERA
ncbi:MAG TPA: RDD family protein [Candidatus Polarisedimenticolaceae bacterium]